MSEDLSPPADSAPDSSAQDLVWMERVKAGDTVALQELIEAHQQRVIGTIAKMLGGELDAEDLAQQVFIRVWRSAPRYQPTAKFTTWLFKITRNLVFNELRRRKRHATQPLEARSEEDAPRPEAPDRVTRAPDHALIEAEMQAAIQHAIDALPEMQRMAIVLRRYDEFSYEEIAEILELSVPAVKSVIFRARTELREKLRQYLEG
jgi:RNA polymerase sigma-70 factor (ECF subfamily)